MSGLVLLVFSAFHGAPLKDVKAIMREPNCTEVRQALELVLTASTARVPTRSMSMHLAACPRCQATIHNLYVRVTDHPAPPTADCERCQAEMAVYIDTLLSAGCSAAAQELPHVWWHIWQCAECAETFELTLTLIDAELRGELQPLATLFKAEEPVRPILRLLTVRRELVARLFAARQILGIAYGTSTEIVVSEESDADHRFQVSIQQAQGEEWSVVVSVEPPVAAVAVFTIGNLVQQAPFDEAGRAVVHGISVADLQNSDTGILIAIEAAD